MNLPVVAEVRDELAASNVLMDKNLGPWPLEVVCFFETWKTIYTGACYRK